MLIAGILLAAGSSSRFGSNKLIHRLSDGTGIAVAAARALNQAVDYSFAVIHSGDDELARQLRAEGLEIVVCAEADQGMARSLACGVVASSEADAWLIALADMPFVNPKTIVAVCRRLEHGT